MRSVAKCRYGFFMDWMKRLDALEHHIQKKIRQGWQVMTPYYKTEVEMSHDGVRYKISIDDDGKITERKMRSR